MKKALFFAGLAAAALTFVGCNKEADYAGNGRKVEIVLSDVATRTINSGMSTEWNAGDELSVFNATAGTTSWSSNIKFTVQDASANRATGEVELTAGAYDWYAFYPYTRAIPNPTTLNPEGSTYERSGYTTVGGQFQTQKMDDNMEHLAGVKVPVFGNVKNVPAGETPVIEMKNAASVVRFKVVNAQEEAIKVLSVKFTAPEDIVGTYYIDFSGAAPSFFSSGDKYVFDNVMVTNADPSGIAPDSNAEYYAVIKPFTAAVGAKLKVEVEAENADGSKKGTTTKEITLSAATEFKPGYIKLLNIPFDATMTNVTAEEIPFEESFEEGAGKFTIDNVIGTGIWTPGTNNGNKFMKGTSHFSSNTEGESWLTSPEIDATSATNGVKLSFKQCINKYFGDVTKEATLWAREKGGEWKQFTISYPALNGTWSAFEEQVVDLSEFKGKTFQFAFKYVGHATAAGTWEVCNVAVTDAVITPEFNAELPGADESLSLTVPATTTSVTINVTGNVAWTASASDGATVAPASGEGAGTVTVSFPANTDPAEKEYTVLVSTDDAAIIAAEGDEFVFSITQEAASSEAKAYPFEETFESGQGDFSINNVTLGEGLTYVWKHDSSNKYMKASAHAGSNKESESWLVSPVVDLKDATSPALYFSQCINKYFGDVTKEATVWIKEEGGEWNQLTIEYPALSGNWSKMTDYTVDIKSYAGKKVQVGFKYTSSTSAAGTWEIKDFNLKEAVTGPVDPELTVSPSLTVEEGKTATISVTTNSDGEKTWSTSDATVATVSNGVVTGVKPGSATITLSIAATANFNTISATIPVTVNEVQTGSHYGKVNTITSGKKYLIAGGNQPRVLVPPTGTSNVKPESAAVTINAGKIESNETTNAYAVTINKNGDDVSIVLPSGKFLVYAGSSTNLKGSDTETDTWTVSEGEYGVFRLIAKSTATLATVRGLVYRAGDSKIFGGYSIANVSGEEYFDIDLYELGAEPTVVSEVTLSSIAVSGQKIDFTVGDTFTFGGVVTATYSDGSTKDVTDDADITAPDLSTAGTKTVTVSYTENEVTKTTTYQVTVSSGSSSSDKVIIIDGSQLTTTATTTVSHHTYDGVDVVFSDGAKSQTSNGANHFSDKAILIGKSGKYIYNATAIPGKIVKFEIYANAGASAKVSVGVNFSASPISQYDASAANTFTATLSELDSVYDCSDKLPADAKYFWYQVTNANNSQVQFRITYE